MGGLKTWWGYSEEGEDKKRVISFNSLNEGASIRVADKTYCKTP